MEFVPSVHLEAPSFPSGFGFTSATILPSRGMTVLQIQANLPDRGKTDLLFAPPSEKLQEYFAKEEEDFEGNLSFGMGSAILIPYANRIRGTVGSAPRTIETKILGRTVVLPANGGGKQAGAEQYAIHGLSLAANIKDAKVSDQGSRLEATWNAGDFSGRWTSRCELKYDYSITSDRFEIQIVARNSGDDRLPIGIGWHPYFALPSGDRRQAQVWIPATKRIEINNYDEVLPTGRLIPVANTEYELNDRPLGDRFFDDCYVDLNKTPEGHTICEVVDPEASYGIRITGLSPQINAVQLYAPPGKPFVVLEHQFNWADPYGLVWPAGTNTGMVLLEPGQSVAYQVRMELFVPGNAR